MTAEILKTKTEEEVSDFIRKRLAFETEILSQLRYVDKDAFKKEHRRFEMSGYEDHPGDCTLQNLDIVNLFADLGIYNYTSYLFLDFHKGDGTLYLKYFWENENLEINLGGYTTVEIINEIFKKTIFSDKRTRRRI